jgi:hypothetical protein
LGFVRICHVQVFSDKGNTSKFIQGHVLAVIQHRRSNPLAVFVVGMNIVFMWVALRLAPMESDEQHSVPAPNDFKVEILAPIAPATAWVNASDSQTHQYSDVPGLQRFVFAGHHIVESGLSQRPSRTILPSTETSPRATPNVSGLDSTHV